MRQFLYIIPLVFLFSTASLAQNKLIEGPENSVTAKAQIIDSSSSATQKTIVVTFVVNEGWHLNANPATLDDLIPTSIEAITKIPSTIKIAYPLGKDFESPIGLIKVYEGTIQASVTVETKEPLDASQIEIFATVQPCKAKICYPPTKITVPLM
jgi:hypothetical protein